MWGVGMWGLGKAIVKGNVVQLSRAVPLKLTVADRQPYQATSFTELEEWEPLQHLKKA